ncbi:MAG: beta-N-acetylglucosaminidase domain-containing protein [Muribaculaceae bacterium]|nr:beta-N-acetylglucosaminidase domain-containing protein [Muribaculaceae bacterium]MBR5171391.1 beta-N-acetylglucosaminidase domain-containing protein [Muribaculaceae bacterium]
MIKKLILIFAMCSALLAAANEPYTIYPVPHKQVMNPGTASFSQEVFILAEPGIDEATINRAKRVLSEHGLTPVLKIGPNTPSNKRSIVLLGVNGSNKMFDGWTTQLKIDKSIFNLPKYDRHIISLISDDDDTVLAIVGENTDAVFCGLASLEQMLDRGTTNLPCVTIYDYADVKERGIIEGYYGVPYSAEVTKDLFRFMARYKMNTYMYGAKSDPYHSRYWGDPYPTTITEDQQRIGYLTQDMMRDITKVAHETKVNFIWAIHPGKAFANAEDPQVLDKIMAKFESMHKLGVRQFGVFVDDVGVPSDPAIMELCADNLTALQQRIDARWNTRGAIDTDTVKPLHYVPQLYAYSWVSQERAREFFESLSTTPEKINIYITGSNVWSVPNNEDLAVVKNWLGREVSWWWNYPCNDQDPTKLFVMDTYSNFRDETHIDNLSRIEKHLKGLNALIINPMQQGELSKIALFSVADYSWNNAAFDNFDSWDAAIPAVVGKEYAKALKKLAPYLRYYDNDAIGYRIDNYYKSIKSGKANHKALLNELREVNDACQVIKEMKNSGNESDRLLYADVRPWLLKLEAMTGEAIAHFEGNNEQIVDYENNPDFQFETLGGMGEEITLKVLTAEPSNQRLMPLLLESLRKLSSVKKANQ